MPTPTRSRPGRPASTGPVRPWRPGLLLALAAAAACDPIEEIRERFVAESPRDAYHHRLREAGLDATALGRDWVEAGERVLHDAPLVAAPFREIGYLETTEAAALALRVAARRGQRVQVEFALDGDPGALVFLDAFRPPADTASAAPQRIASADERARVLVFDVRRDGELLIRVQPELLRGGRYTLTVTVGPALAFPVERAGSPDIGSVFGDPRDGGRRRHHGIDVFAPRGRPVLAAADGIVTRVGETPVGGRVVWIRDEARQISLYYAHLDAHIVERGQPVAAGDTIGFVGNTGNARTTPPHLHFGIYARGEGPIDPQPFVAPRRATPAVLAVDTSRIGQWARVARDGLVLRASPDTQADVRTMLPRYTAVRVLAGAGVWYRVRLPDATHGFVDGRLLEPADRPIDDGTIAAGTTVLAAPMHGAPVVEEIGADADVRVLARFGEFLLVSVNGGRTAWLPAAGAD